MDKLGFDAFTLTRTKTWADPLRWQAEAQAQGIHERVFTCSWSDWFHPDADPWRPEAWEIVRRCPNLIFQILTKRAELIPDRLPQDWGQGYPNAWLGASVENPNFLHRMDQLRQVPAVIRFISAEPLLAPLGALNLEGFHWVIVGGESGRGFRPMDHAWAREIRDQCQGEHIPYFFKQSAAIRTEMGTELDGREWREYPA
jgi:protein gp37